MRSWECERVDRRRGGAHVALDDACIDVARKRPREEGKVEQEEKKGDMRARQAAWTAMRSTQAWIQAKQATGHVTHNFQTLPLVRTTRPRPAKHTKEPGQTTKSNTSKTTCSYNGPMETHVTKRRWKRTVVRHTTNVHVRVAGTLRGNSQRTMRATNDTGTNADRLGFKPREVEDDEPKQRHTWRARMPAELQVRAVDEERRVKRNRGTNQ